MNPHELDSRLRFAVDAARRAGDLALVHARHPETMGIEIKGIQDVVTVADKSVEKALRAEIAAVFPHDAMLGEEEGITPGWDGVAPLWIVDPIDGTANFARRLPLWCISIGLYADGEPVLGVIHNPVTDELHAAAKGRGATLNGAPIRASKVSSPQHARINLGFSYRRDPTLHVASIERLLTRECEYSRLGSGALGLAYVANGRYEGYWEAHINAWDVAAGIVLVTEAGGWCNDFFGGPDAMAKGNFILAATPALVPPLRALLSR